MDSAANHLCPTRRERDVDVKKPLAFLQKRTPVKPATGQPPVRITSEARDKILSIRGSEPEAQRLAVWVEVTGEADSQYTYDIYLLPLDEAGPQDAVIPGDPPIVVSGSSIDKVAGATIEFSGDAFTGGLWLDNPNKPPPSMPKLPIMNIPPIGGSAPSPSPAVGAKPPPDLSGDVAQRVSQVLEQQINPSIAAHGGRADLVAVENATAYLRLSGGCQGCGMATVTLSQGIEVAIKEAVPDIAEVVDVTDHQSGTNPYFQASKK